MNDPFSEVPLREGGLFTDALPPLTTARCSWTVPAVYNAKMGGSDVGNRVAEAIHRSSGIKP